MDRERLELELTALATCSPAQLRDKWRVVTGAPLPLISPRMLRLALGYELQAAVHGGLSRRTSQKLDQLMSAKTETAEVRSGMQLVREWGGTLHVVTVENDGSLLWKDQRWTSLSQIARAITGTRWSGPAFFGLKKPKAAAA